MDGDEEAAELRIANVRGLVMALQAIKPAKPQARQPSGLSARAYHSSHAP